MRSLCRTRSGGIILGLGGLLVLFYLFTLMRIFPGPARAQALPTPGQLPAADAPISPSFPDSTRPASGSYALPPTQQPLTSREALQSQGIDQLVEHLNALRAKKAELDRQEKETVSVLREKLKQQKEKLQKLGILDDTPLGADTLLPPAHPTAGYGPSKK